MLVRLSTVRTVRLGYLQSHGGPEAGFVMISLQNKIIYAPYFPPTARFEKIEDWHSKLFGIEWKEIHLRSIDGTDLALAVATVSSDVDESFQQSPSHHVYVLYLQGNASSLPPRLPDHSWILRKIKTSFKETYPGCGKVRFTQVGLSYRGYWSSAGSANETGINLDTIAAVQWISQLHENTYSYSKSGGQATRPILFVWGQSIGAGFASNLAASGLIPPHLEPTALIFETPFLSIKAMLASLYPERWLPYKYLHPFLRNSLDSYHNLGTIAAHRVGKGIRPPRIFILEAGRDDIVPPNHPKELQERCMELDLPVERVVVPEAFHSDAMGGRINVAHFIMRQTAKNVYATGSKSPVADLP
ncbi:hypothetical protein KVR01_006657 [Diaporthe batatas]|uniref:uncharacterized protein n=1 Tax=Diaporthe batatas TaxID=748121 RepID=UPI001D058CCF|nr:uncharacterized protein KVR01_006657 [Diaporthe batatas]KAG8163360.1 hypothetical protein KVR01_006657 [Diaporthe batatas]